MAAFQEGFPGLTVFLTFGHSLPRVESDGGEKPLAESTTGCSPRSSTAWSRRPRAEARLVDGFELSYGYREKARFDAAYRLMKEGRPADRRRSRPKYRRVVSGGLRPLDGLRLAEDGWDVDDPSKNYFTPETFESSLRRALERTDQLVWIYTETPRWWSEEGDRVKLPDAYDRAIRRARMPD